MLVRGYVMKNLLGKIVSLELGIVSSATEKVKGVVEELIKQGQVGEGEAKKVIDSLVKLGEKNKEEIKKYVGKMIADTLHGLDIPTRKELQKLNKDLEELKKGLKKTKRGA